MKTSFRYLPRCPELTRPACPSGIFDPAVGSRRSRPGRRGRDQARVASRAGGPQEGAVAEQATPAVLRAESLAFQYLILDLAEELGEVGDRLGQARSEAEQVEVGH